MHDGVEAAAFENALHCGPVAGICQDEFGLCRERPPCALAEIVQHGDRMPAAQKMVATTLPMYPAPPVPEPA